MLEKERRGDYLGKTVQVIKKASLIYVDHVFGEIPLWERGRFVESPLWISFCRLFLISLMLFKNGLSVQLGFLWMDSQVQLMFVS